MKINTIRFSICALLCSAVTWSCQTTTKKDTVDVIEKPIIILDTDISPDYDDVGAMAVLHALADSGYITPLAVIASNAHPLVVPSIEILNRYYGRPDLPIAAPKAPNAPNEKAVQGWPEMLVEKYPHTLKSSDDAPDAIETYRKLLASQADTSVTVVTIGFLTNLAHLLDSQADENSPLNGKDLVQKKVKRLVSMAGLFPEGREYNVFIDSLASEKVFNNWPTEIIFSGFEIGKKVITGNTLIHNEKVNSPIKEVYAKAMPHWKSDSLGRMSWDQTAVLVAAKGHDPYYTLQRGKFITRGGNNGWKNDPNGKHAYLVEKMPYQDVTKIIEDLMMYMPSKK
jgi:inosine-uridine nucleoside N-ribohydrolase